MILGLPKHPKQYIKEGKADEYVAELVSRIQTVVDAFYPKPVWVRTLDAPTDEFRAMEGGEANPLSQINAWIPRHPARPSGSGAFRA